MRLPRPRLLGFATLLVLSSACFEAPSFCPEHGDGPVIICPEGSRCAAAQGICIYDSCGDGVVDVGEVCDDGNKISGDGCKADCKSDETCGNMIVDTAVGEVCDDGNTVSGDGCWGDCRSAEGCGNGVVDTARGETCDDGNTDAGDDCTFPACQFGLCGDGIVKLSGHNVEQCDEGGQAATCDLDCTFPACGDGLVNGSAGEQCDVGTIPGCDGDAGTPDACDTSDCDGRLATNGNACTITRCGDGYRNAKAGEECDTGGESASCDGPSAGVNACTVAVCGDGHLNTAAGETCDVTSDTNNCDGPAAGAQKCTQAQCGDGYANDAHGEECDDNNTSDNDNCTHFCMINVCGDGFQNLQGTEACDDGNANACGTCSASCGASAIPTAATGWIDALRCCGSNGANFRDGDIFIIDDGLHPAITFEIDQSGAVGTGHVSIHVAIDESDVGVAGKIMGAINSIGDNLWITAATTSNQRVYLTHDAPTALGNRPIIEGVASTYFSFQPMQGGLAGDCGSGTGCGSGADCSPLLACDVTTHICKVPVPKPIVSGTAPASPANNNFPVVTGMSAPSMIVRIYGNAACTGSVFGSAVADTGGNFSIAVTVADDSTSTFYAQATDGVGSTSACSSTFATYVEDSTPPASPTVTGSTPASPANNTNPTIAGVAEAGSLVRLYTDGSCFGAAAGSGTATGGAFSISVTVGNGTTTTFRATAQDAAGNVSACSASTLTYVEVP